MVVVKQIMFSVDVNSQLMLASKIMLSMVPPFWFSNYSTDGATILVLKL